MLVVIRSARLNDVSEILAIEQRAASASHWTSAQYGKLINDGVVLVAELDAEDTGKLCGFLCAQIVAGEWEIENVVVAAEFLRRGVASELMFALIQRAREGRASAILLEVESGGAWIV
jgi:ribosomal protein S18 acetylase RimI-like enzyme